MITIPANDHGAIRVFGTQEPLSPAVRDKTPQGLAEIFGAELDPTYVDIVQISDLGGMSLSAYIAEGYDMVPDATDENALSGLTGTAILVLSRAAMGQDLVLTPASGIIHVTTLSPTIEIRTPESLPVASAKSSVQPETGKPAKSDARIGGMIATYALIFMFAFIAVIIWIAG